MSATEHRIFPIAWLDNQLVVIEVFSYRHDKLELRKKELVENWTSKIYMSHRHQNGFVKSYLLDSLNPISTDGLLVKLEQLVEQEKLNFEEKARISGFEKLEFLSYDSTRSANYLSTNQEEIFLKVGDKERYFPFDSIPEIGQVALSRISGFDLDSNLEKSNFLRINSIRTFQVGGKRLRLFHISCGDFNLCNTLSWNDDKSKRKRGEMKAPKLNSSVFFESMPHHGIGFDFLVWE